MESLLVGDENCSYNRVISAMSNSKNFQVIAKEWDVLANELCCSDNVTLNIERNIKYEGWKGTRIIQEILSSFRQKFAAEATLQKLIEVLEKCHLNDISNEIRKEFSSSTDNYSPNKLAYYQKKTIPYKPTSSTSNYPIQHHSSGQSMQTENNSIVNPEGQTVVENVSVECSFSSILNKITGTRKITPYDWDARIISPNESSVVSLAKQPQTLRDDFYNLPGISQGNGFALILNIIRYKSGYRKGAQYDSFMLTQLLTQLGYQVVKYDDSNAFFTKDDVKGIVELFRDHIRYKQPASVLVFVGCHGMYKEIQTSDEKLANLYKTIVYQFDSTECPELEKVPKIFIVQCCRNFDDKDAPGFRNIENAIICYATLPGNYATRNEQTGSIFVELLVKVVSENAHHMHLIQMLNKTETELSKETIRFGGNSNNRQQSSYEVLSKFGNFYFKF